MYPNNIKLMNIFVTGACGYKGTVLVPKLLLAGHKVTAFDLMWFGNKLHDHENLKVVNGDVRKIKDFSFATAFFLSWSPILFAKFVACLDIFKLSFSIDKILESKSTIFSIILSDSFKASILLLSPSYILLCKEACSSNSCRCAFNSAKLAII